MTECTGMRMIVATAAAGALIVGSAVGAVAAPGKGKPAKKTGNIQISKVDIKRHSPINVDSVATARNLKLSVTLRDTDPSASVTNVTVTLAQFDNKSST